MADVLALRTALRAANATLDAAQQTLDELASEMDDPDLPPFERQVLHARVMQQAQVVGQDKQQRDAAQAAYTAAVAADPMAKIDPTLPLVLLPVRIETAYLTDATGTNLVVRVYPDDIHVDAHEPELTAAELTAGTTYWQAVWGAGPNQARLDAAWNALLGRLKPNRAAWAVHILTPSVPRPADETPPDQPQPQPPLPSVATRPSNFTRAAHTTLLPGLWNFIGFRNGNEVFNVTGSFIPDTLAVSFGPPATGATATDLPFDQASRWLVDLDAAIAVGMAVKIPLTGSDLALDQLFVLGVLDAVSPDEAAARLETTLVAHQYTNGLGFLPPGTPTNNTSATRSAWQSAPQPPTPSEVDAARSQYLATSNQNAALAAKALGIDGSEVLSIADNGLLDQQTPVFALQRQLWNAIEGKALSLLLQQWDVPPGQSPSQGSWNPHVDPTAIGALQEHVLGWVRSRGTLPTLRVGNQPYGLLPATSLADWIPAANDPTAPIVAQLRQFQQYFEAAIASAPRVVVGSGRDPDSTVADILMRLPVSQSIYLRHDGDPLSGALSNQPIPAAPIPGLPTNSELFFSAPALDNSPMPIPIVGDGVADQGLLQKYLTFFSDSISVLKGTMTQPAWADKYQSLFGASTFPGAPPPDLFTSLLQDSFTDPLENVNNSVLAGIVFGALVFDEKKNDPTFQQQIQQILPLADQFIAQFSQVCAMDPANYEPVLRELLDIASHRFDAWVTSLPARRLDQVRAATPTGIMLGAYGWVEDLAPRTDLTAVPNPPPGLDNLFSSDVQKYIHAPSLQHAATGAVLRAGYESHPDHNTLAVNLESRRVRTADWLASGVRNGQTVGALLGYRFERELHDASLDGLIEGLRKQFPLPLLPLANNAGSSSHDVVAASNVVDGLALIRNSALLPTLVPPSDLAAVSKIVEDISDALDALGDLLLAESVHHLVGGNPLRAGLSADTIGRGETLPDRYEVVRTPRSGRPLTWQLGALMPASFVAAASGWNGGRPRAALEPHLEAWLESMLGNAGNWQIACTVTTSSGAASSLKIGLDTLGLCALDIVCESSGKPSTLERRVLDFIAASQPVGSTIAIARDRTTDGSLGFGELTAFGDRLRLLTSQATTLGPQQLMGADASATDGIDLNELEARINGLATSLSAASTSLVDAAAVLASAEGADTPTIMAAVHSAKAELLALADIGIAPAFPLSGAEDDPATFTAISAQASAVLAVVQPIADLEIPPTPAANATSAQITSWLGGITEYAHSVTGKIFSVTPTFLLPADSVFAAAFADGAAPVGADIPSVMAWLRRMARVRNNTAALYDALLASEFLAGAAVSLTSVQLPVEAGARWVGLPFGDVPPPKARLATVLTTPAPIDPSVAFCGLLFDHWTEQLPGLTSVADPAKGYEASEVTGMAFTVDAPDAYPPQAILIAMNPNPTTGWSLDILYDVVQETLDLAKVRAADLGDLPRLGRVLPTVHTGFNLDNVFNAAKVP